MLKKAVTVAVLTSALCLGMTSCGVSKSSSSSSSVEGSSSSSTEPSSSESYSDSSGNSKNDELVIDGAVNTAAVEATLGSTLLVDGVDHGTGYESIGATAVDDDTATTVRIDAYDSDMSSNNHFAETIRGAYGLCRALSEYGGNYEVIWNSYGKSRSGERIATMQVIYSTATMPAMTNTAAKLAESADSYSIKDVIWESLSDKPSVQEK